MKLNSIDLNKLYVFTTVIKHQGYSGASEELHLTKAAISQSISTLEGQLGKKLFVRAGNRMQATREAEKLYGDLLTQQNQLQKSMQNFLGETQTLEGELRIGAYFEFAKSKLMPVVEQFLNDYQDSSLRFRFESPSHLDRLLREQKIDLSISIYPHKNTKSIRSHKLIQQELILVAKKSRFQEVSNIHDVLALPIIDYFSDHVLFKRWLRHHFGVKHSVDFKIRAYAASAEMVLELVRRGLGAGVVPRYVAEAHIESGELLVIAPKKERLYDFIWLNEWRDQTTKPLQKEFIRRLKNSFA